MLDLLHDQPSKIQKALLQYANGNMEQAIETLQAAKDMNKESVDDVNAIIEFLNWNITKLASEKDELNNLSDDDIVYLSNLTENKANWAAAQAKAILDNANNKISDATAYYPSDGSTSRKAHKVRPVGQDEQLGMEVMPNPAKDFATVKYHLDEIDLPTSTTLKVTSLDGKLMREIVLTHVQDQIIIDTKSLSNGAYIISITDNKVLYKKAKLEVIH
jgi:hypothetical protein